MRSGYLICEPMPVEPRPGGRSRAEPRRPPRAPPRLVVLATEANEDERAVVASLGREAAARLCGEVRVPGGEGTRRVARDEVSLVRGSIEVVFAIPTTPGAVRALAAGAGATTPAEAFGSGGGAEAGARVSCQGSFRPEAAHALPTAITAASGTTTRRTSSLRLRCPAAARRTRRRVCLPPLRSSRSSAGASPRAVWSAPKRSARPRLRRRRRGPCRS